MGPLLSSGNLRQGNSDRSYCGLALNKDKGGEDSTFSARLSGTEGNREIFGNLKK